MWLLCTKCNKHKALWEFSRKKKSNFGVQVYCKMCGNLINKKYRHDNILKRAEYKKNYNLVNKDKNNAYSKNYHSDNRDIILQRQHTYRKNNMDKDALRSAKRRAIKKEQGAVLDPANSNRIDLLYKWSNYLGNDFQVDHIKPLSRGGLHHPDNMHIIPRTQNLIKKDKDPEEFYGRFYYFIIGKY